MRILLTGASGALAHALAPRLAANDHDVVLLDSEPLRAARYTTVQADIRDSGAITAAMHGCEAVIHGMGCDQDMAARRNYDDFYGANVTGTHNILLAMLRLGIKNLVFLSSDAVYGASIRDRRVIDDRLPRVPSSIYSLTKALGEEMCEFYARQHGYHIAILRCGDYGMAGADWRDAGLGLLTTTVDPNDVAQAVELALGLVLTEELRCDAFLIRSATPFVDDDWPELFQNPNAVVERHWPGSIDLLADHGLAVPQIHHRYDISHAATTLGYAPEHNFDQFLTRLRREPPA